MKNRIVSPDKRKDCWNRIGINGDKSCPELKKFIHCHSCPEYSRAGQTLFDRQLPQDYRKAWTEHLAREKEAVPTGTVSLVAFRIGSERLTLPAHLFKEVTEANVIHGIPHKNNKILKGLVNIHGKIQLCFSLGGLLGIEEESEERDENTTGRKVYKRMIVITWEREDWVFPVDEILGIHRFRMDKIRNTPETVAKAGTSYTIGIFTWHNRNIGYLDHELVFSSLKRSIL